MNRLQEILFNILGGIVVALLTLLIRWAFYKMSARRFRHVFSDDADSNFHIIYTEYKSPSKETVFPKAKPLIARVHAQAATNLTTINSCATTRAVGHLVYAFGKNIKTSPKVCSDIDTDEDMALSSISIGGVTNFKSCDLLNDPANIFLNFQNSAIVNIKSKLPIVRLGEPHIDYGLIIKIHPKSNPKQTWICCAGFGEWATSGSAWYLANRWKEIRQWAGDKPFACVVKTKSGSDNSTEPIECFIKKNNLLTTAIRKISFRKKHFKITQIE